MKEEDGGEGRRVSLVRHGLLASPETSLSVLLICSAEGGGGGIGNLELGYEGVAEFPAMEVGGSVFASVGGHRCGGGLCI